MGWCWAIVGQSWDNYWLILTKKKLDKVGKDYETRSQSYELRFNMIQQNRTCHQWYSPRNILLFIYVWVPKMIRSTRNSWSFWSFCPWLGGINLYEGLLASRHGWSDAMQKWQSQILILTGGLRVSVWCTRDCQVVEGVPKLKLLKSHHKDS